MCLVLCFVFLPLHCIDVQSNQGRAENVQIGVSLTYLARARLVNLGVALGNLGGALRKFMLNRLSDSSERNMMMLVI